MAKKGSVELRSLKRFHLKAVRFNTTKNNSAQTTQNLSGLAPNLAVFKVGWYTFFFSS
jgi:hypothetical protein